jgi:hypothetical protein
MCIKKKDNLVLDRSLYEDIHIFAKYWMENYNIDEKEEVLYKRISEFFLDSIPSPDLIIYVQCSDLVSNKRIKERGIRDFEKYYPPNHIEKLCKRYDQLLLDLTKQNSSIILSINSENNNFNDNAVQEKIINEIINIVETPVDTKTIQLSLWDDTNHNTKRIDKENRIFKIIHRPEFSKTYRMTKYMPKIYIAAPFTAYATQARKTNDRIMFDLELNSTGYGLITPKYKKLLQKIEKLLKDNYYVSTSLPHRDINEWGKKEIPPTEVLKQLVSNLVDTNFIVAIPADSFGVHMELAIALNRNLPMIVFEVIELKNSFFVKSFETVPNCLFLKVSKMSDITKSLVTDDAVQFFKKYLEEK